MTLLEECLDALDVKHNAIIKNKENKEKIVKKMIERFPPTFYGRIDWEKCSNKYNITSHQDIITLLKSKGKETNNPVYILWSDSSMPIVQSNLKKILEHFDDVEAVSPNTWLYCPFEKWVIELYHDGDITLGFE